MVDVGAGNLKLDRPADDDVGSLDRPAPLRTRRMHDYPGSCLRCGGRIGQRRQGGRGRDSDDHNKQPEPAGAQPIGAPLHRLRVGSPSGAGGNPKEYSGHSRDQRYADRPNRVLQHCGPQPLTSSLGRELSTSGRRSAQNPSAISRNADSLESRICLSSSSSINPCFLSRVTVRLTVSVVRPR